VAGATRDEPASVELAELCYGAGLAAFRRGDNGVSRRWNEESLAVAAAVGSDRGRSRALIGLSRVAFRDGDYRGGTELAREAGGIARACGDEAGALLAMHMEAELARAAGDYAAARPLYERLLEADRATGDDRGLAMELGNLGSVLVQVGELDRTEACLREAVDRTVQTGAIDQLPYCLLGLGGLAARRHDPLTAGRLIGAVEAFLELASHVEPAQAAGETFDEARSSGRRLTIDTAVRQLLDG
jgi:tetratricopeptide (TPR) repeat protein